MITKDKINIYLKYNADIDSWARYGTKSDKNVLKDDDWYTIDKLIQNATLLKNNLASEKFKDKLNEEINNSCHDKTVIDKIFQMV